MSTTERQPTMKDNVQAKTLDVAGISDERWRLTVSTGLRVARLDSADSNQAAPTPSQVLPQALDYIDTLLPAEIARFTEQFEWGRSGRKGAIKISEALEDRIQDKLRELRLAALSLNKRQLVVVALYAYALHLQGAAQKRAYGFIAADISASLKDLSTFDKVLKETNIAPRRLRNFRNNKSLLASDLANGSAMIEATMIYQAQGRNALKVLHAATVAGSDDEFKHLMTQQHNDDQQLAKSG